MKPLLRAAVLLTTIGCASLRAQAPRTETPALASKPTVTFSFDWPRIEPHRYRIAVEDSGNAIYQSWTAEAETEPPSGDDSYRQTFTMSAPARDRIFALARELRYFNGDFEYRKHPVAVTGEKILAYADAERRFETRYNWSENQGVGDLTALFQGISMTIESGRRLKRLRRFDRLGLDEELKSLEHFAVERRAVELQAIAPVLLEIAGDSAVLNIARQRARHILQIAGVPLSADTKAFTQ